MEEFKKLFKEYLEETEEIRHDSEYTREQAKLRFAEAVIEVMRKEQKNDRPSGKWIKKVDDVGFISHICSECGAEIEVENPIDDKYCWNCGADMRGEKE